MGRGRDLTLNERTVVAVNIKRFWNYEKKQISHGKLKEIMMLSAASGVPVGKNVVGDKPLLTHENKKKRVRYALDKVDKRHERERYNFFCKHGYSHGRRELVLPYKGLYSNYAD